MDAIEILFFFFFWSSTSFRACSGNLDVTYAYAHARTCDFLLLVYINDDCNGL